MKSVTEFQKDRRTDSAITLCHPTGGIKYKLVKIV